MKLRSRIWHIGRDQRGAVFALAAVSILGFVGFAAAVVDIGYLFYVKRVLQASSDAAALAGASQIPCCGSNAAVSAALAYSSAQGGKNADPNLTVTATPQPVNCSMSTGSACNPDSSHPNGMQVTQTATVPLFFATALGFDTASITTTSYALAAGGTVARNDIMVILDTTGSMNTTDSACSATREDCALAGLRTLLGGFNPTNQQVGLMVFPGLTSTTAAAQEYDCSSTTPPSAAIAPYNASSDPPNTTPPVYLIVGLSSDYKLGGSLNPSSNLVLAARGGGSGCSAGITAYGGVGTYYADVLTAAQNYLAANGRSGVNKMIILLSDGDAGAPNSTMPISKVTNQCQQGLTAAQAAQSAGITVVTIGYGSPGAGSCATDSGNLTACQTLMQMASVGKGSAAAPQWFYSDSASACTGAYSASSLNDIFASIGASVTSGTPRLIPSS